MHLRKGALLRLAPVVGGCVVIALVLAWMSGALRRKTPPGTTALEPLVAGNRPLARVQRLRTEQREEAVGSVRPRHDTSVASQLMATVLEITVEPADRVTAGQLLVRLDDRDVQAQVQAAEAGVSAANANLANARDEFARYQKLLENGTTTREEYDSIKDRYQVAQTQLQIAEQRRQQTAVTLGHTRIKAPVAGVVTGRYADPGDLATPGKPLLSLHNPDEMELHARVREALVGELRPGMKLSVRVEAVGLDVQGTVREIVPEAQTASRDVVVKVSLPGAKAASVYTGMFGRMWIPVGHADRVVVPVAAVRRVGQLEMVDVVGPDGTLQRRLVKTGTHWGKHGEKVEILSGVEPGETVALFPTEKKAPLPEAPDGGGVEPGPPDARGAP